jgi:hypothetical protein
MLMASQRLSIAGKALAGEQFMRASILLQTMFIPNNHGTPSTAFTVAVSVK